jgi:hypothetical protein
MRVFGSKSEDERLPETGADSIMKKFMICTSPLKTDNKGSEGNRSEGKISETVFT